MSAGGRKNPLCCDVRSSWQQNPSEQGKSKQESLVNLVLLSWVFPRTFLGASDSLPGPSCVHCPAFSHPGKCHPMSPKPPTACVQGQGWAVQQHPELRNIHLQLGVACVTTHANMKIILLSLHFFYLQWFFFNILAIYEKLVTSSACSNGTQKTQIWSRWELCSFMGISRMEKADSKCNKLDHRF